MDIREQAIHEYLVEGKTYRQLAGFDGILFPALRQYLFVNG